MYGPFFPVWPSSNNDGAAQPAIEQPREAEKLHNKLHSYACTYVAAAVFFCGRNAVCLLDCGVFAKFDYTKRSKFSVSIDLETIENNLCGGWGALIRELLHTVGRERLASEDNIGVFRSPLEQKVRSPVPSRSLPRRDPQSPFATPASAIRSRKRVTPIPANSPAENTTYFGIMPD